MSKSGRPTCVTVISWVWILIGAFWSFTGMVNLIVWCVSFASLSVSPNRPLEFLPFMGFLFSYVFLVPLVAGPVAFVAGIQFLRLRVWARAVLEGFSWFLLVFTVGWGVLIVCAVFSGEMRRFVGMDDMPELVPSMMVSIGIGSILFYGGLVAIMLRYLRGQTVRDALQHAARTPA